MQPRGTRSRRLSTKSAGRPNRPPQSRLFRDIMAGLKEVRAHVRGEIALPERVIQIPGPVDVRAIRTKTGLSQADFAARYCFSVRTLQEWEQGRAQPDGAVRAYLAVIERNPKTVARALAP